MPNPVIRPGGWQEAWGRPGFRIHATASLVALFLTLAALTRFLSWVEERPGVVLDDPVLALMTPRDSGVLIFALIYGGMSLAVVTLVRRPLELLRAVQSYTLLLLLRILCMWVTPLDPPAGFVPLHDPLVESFGPAEALSRDLFFSGHVSTLFLLSLCVRVRWARWLLGLATPGVAGLLMWQHVHYALDVVVAPLAAFCAYALAGRLAPGRWLRSG